MTITVLAGMVIPRKGLGGEGSEVEEGLRLVRNLALSISYATVRF